MAYIEPKTGKLNFNSHKQGSIIKKGVSKYKCQIDLKQINDTYYLQGG
jgi:hypothetical protein